SAKSRSRRDATLRRGAAADRPSGDAVHASGGARNARGSRPWTARRVHGTRLDDAQSDTEASRGGRLDRERARRGSPRALLETHACGPREAAGGAHVLGPCPGEAAQEASGRDLGPGPRGVERCHLGSELEVKFWRTIDVYAFIAEAPRTS